MSEAQAVEKLVALAKRVRGDCNRIMVSGMMNDGKEAAELAAELCGVAADVLAEVEMGKAVADPGRYDLATLPAVKGGASPEWGEE